LKITACCLWVFASLFSLSVCVGGGEPDLSWFHDPLLETTRPSEVVRRWEWTVDPFILKDLFALRDVSQSSKWHPEGEAYVHTLLVLDAAAQDQYQSCAERLVFLYAALCHDLGKAECGVDDGNGLYGHGPRGVPLARLLLSRLGIARNHREQICEIVRYHMCPEKLVRKELRLREMGDDLAADVTYRPVIHITPEGSRMSYMRGLKEAMLVDYKELAHSLNHGVTVADLLRFAHFDFRGCSATGEPLVDKTFPELEHFRLRAQQAGVLK